MTRRFRTVAVAGALVGMFCAAGCTGRPGPGASGRGATTRPAGSGRQTIRALVARLKSPDPLVRARAILALAQLDYELALAESPPAVARRVPFSPADRAAVSVPRVTTVRVGAGPGHVRIVDSATGKTMAFRPRLTRPRLQVMRTWVDEAVPALSACVYDADPRVRYAAVWALADLDDASWGVLLTVNSACHDEDRWIRKVADDAFAALGRVDHLAHYDRVPRYEELSRRDEPPRRDELSRRDEPPRPASTAPVSLKVKVLEIAAGRRRPEEVSKLGPKVLPAVLKHLRGVAVWSARSSSPAVAEMLKPFGPPALEGLARQLTDADKNVSGHAADVLIHMGAEAVAVLGRGVADKNVDVRLCALKALSKMVPMSYNAKQHDYPLVFRQALHKIATPIGRCLTDDQPRVRYRAAEILAYLPYQGIPALAPALRDTRAPVRLLGLRTLRRLLRNVYHAAPGERATVLAVGALLGSADPEESTLALAVLGAFRGRAGPAVNDLRKMLTHRDAKIRAKVATILGVIGPAAAPATGALETATKDRDLLVALSATEALKAIRARKDNDKK